MNDSDPLTVTLTAGEWNRVLALMGEAPFKVSADLILAIRQQCMQQQQEAAPPAAANGSTRAGIGTDDPARPSARPSGKRFELEPAAHAPD